MLRIKTGSRRRSITRSWSKDRKSTRLNSSHLVNSYAVFCLKKKNYHVADINTADNYIHAYRCAVSSGVFYGRPAMQKRRLQRELRTMNHRLGRRVGLVHLFL